MVEALLALEGAQCISLGTQMPLLEIAQASAAHRADVVALSFSAAFPVRQIAGLLQQLRASLPPAARRRSNVAVRLALEQRRSG